MNDFELAEVSLKDELDARAAVQDAISQICIEEELADDAAGPHHPLSADGMVALSELVYQYATTSLSTDLRLFSKHAGRRTVQVDDVLLAARKDPDGLLAKLRTFGEQADLPAFRSSSAGKSTATSGVGDVMNQRNAIISTPTTQRMQALRERLQQGIDSSSDDDMHDEMVRAADMKPAAKADSREDSDSVVELKDSLDCSDNDDPLAGVATATKENDESKRKATSLAKDPFETSEDEDDDNDNDEQFLEGNGLIRLGTLSKKQAPSNKVKQHNVSWKDDDSVELLSD